MTDFFAGDCVHIMRDPGETLCGVPQSQLPDDPRPRSPFHQCPRCFELMRNDLRPRVADPTIPPALSATEWAKGATGDEDTGDVFRGEDGSLNLVLEHRVCVQILNPHGTAALCLHQQSFGFTAEDVALLRSLGEYLLMIQARTDSVASLQSIASRIAALLPPSDPQP